MQVYTASKKYSTHFVLNTNEINNEYMNELQ